jgi:glycosyltransferase involved in cell wall biosynthesis
MSRLTSVTVVLPAFNEGADLAPSLAKLSEYFALHQGYAFRYIIVDDGSSDDTFKVAQDFARWRPNVRVLQHQRNQGVGAALRTAFKEVDTDLAVVLDVDLSYEPRVAMELIEALDRGNADIALASPYMRGGSVVNVPFVRRVLSREGNRFLSLATAGQFATLTCMVRAYRTSALRQLEFCTDGKVAIAEMLLNGLRKKMRVIELPATLRWSPQRRSDCGRLDIRGLISQTAATVILGCSHRPSLWLAVPGLIPGLLPFVVMVLLLLHVSTQVLEIGTIATLVVQYASLALFTGQIGAFIARTFRQRPRTTTITTTANGVTQNGYSLPHRVP